MSEKITVWIIGMAKHSRMLEAMNALPLPEQARARKYKKKEHGLWWAYVRSSTREILAKYCACAPTNIEFSESEFGKPFLDYPNYSQLIFNVSHTQNIALVAVSQNSQTSINHKDVTEGVNNTNSADCIKMALGVDIESVKPMSDMTMVASRFFSLKENAFLKNAATEQKLDTFYSIWTKKEALIKAHGKGLGIDLTAFCTADVDSNTWHSIMFEGENYRMTELNLPNDIALSPHKAALCLKVPKSNEIGAEYMQLNHLAHHLRQHK